MITQQICGSLSTSGYQPATDGQTIQDDQSLGEQEPVFGGTSWMDNPLEAPSFILVVIVLSVNPMGTEKHAD